MVTPSWVSKEDRGNSLRLYRKTDLSVLGLVDDTYAALAERLEDPVLRNCLTYHGCLLPPTLESSEVLKTAATR